MSTIHIQARDLLSGLFSNGEHSATEVSRKIGRSDAFVSVYLTTQRMPNLELTANVLDAIDYDLIAVNRKTGREILIEPSCND